jgi:para-aminobenzoate synthetase component 1
MNHPKVWTVEEINDSEILFDINGFTNATIKSISNQGFIFQVDQTSLTIEAYQKKYDTVRKHLNFGDTFLANLTVKTKIETNRSLQELFYLSKARYKVWYNNQFLVFSPEIFIQIKDQQIFSFPMKGTIDASIPDANNKILSDEKELAEHITIVDLIRNDLSIMATNVRVNRFRYVEEIKTKAKDLLQVSSEIIGDLPNDYQMHIGSILVSLLPAGSISGAPKRRTLEIIQEAEGEEREFYTGVVGYFDGKNLDAGVMIRYIEKTEKGLFFRSGGGITTQSNMINEYHEVMDKIYAPVY